MPVFADPATLCIPATNADEFADKVVIVDRGECAFEDKYVLASMHGAIAVVILSKAFICHTMLEGHSSTGEKWSLVVLGVTLFEKKLCAQIVYLLKNNLVNTSYKSR